MLTIIPTPIGNLDDITFRALEKLKGVDQILAEDTRVSGRLLQHFNISTPLRSYHVNNEHRIVDSVVSDLLSGKEIALVSDAGTPGISDPAYLLVQACISAGIKIECLPGATAFVPALVVSGLPSHHFYFEGFLPHKKGRHSRLKYLATLDVTFILYESPHRIARCIRELIDHCGNERQACICRELTKLHEEVVRGSLEDLKAWSESKPKIKGEIVVVVQGTGR